MSEQSRKCKMISLRLSEPEYEDLKAHYRAHGARNISELARLALQRMVVEKAASQDGVAAKLSKLDERVQQLEVEFSIFLERERSQQPALEPCEVTSRH